MDQRERYDDAEEAIRSAMDGLQQRIWTSLPCKVVNYDASKQTVTLQTTVKSMQKMPDGSVKQVSMPVLQDVPVKFPSGGGVTITMPLKPGDEGSVHFASRAIDAWHQSGDVQAPTDARMHDLSDGTFHPGGKSQPNAIKNVSAESTQIRSDDGKHVLDIHPTNGFTQTSDKPLNITGDLHITGDLYVNGIKFSTHKHTGVMAGGQTTQGPTN